MKITCKTCKEERSISKKGFEKKLNEDSKFKSKYVCRTCKGQTSKEKKQPKKKTKSNPKHKEDASE